MKRYKIPLSSDAYSNLSAPPPPPSSSHSLSAKYDPQRDQSNREVLEATNHLLTSTVPAFARWLESHAASLRLSQHLTALTEIVHREGINVRYLGLIRGHVGAPELKRLLLMEMAARSDLSTHLRGDEPN